MRMISFIDSLKAFGRLTINKSELSKIQKQIFEESKVEVDLNTIKIIANNLGFKVEE